MTSIRPRVIGLLDLALGVPDLLLQIVYDHGHAHAEVARKRWMVDARGDCKFSFIKK